MVSSRKNTAPGLRAQVFSVVSPQSGSRASQVFNALISGLIVASVALIVVDTFELSSEFLFFSFIVQGAITIIFTIEYLLRFWTSDQIRPHLSPAKARLHYLISFPSIVDLLAILPFWLFVIMPYDLRFLGAFRALRLLRLLRLGYYSKALAVVGQVLKASAKQLVATFLLLLLLMLVASILMYNAEHSVQPEVFENAFSGFWWAMQTVTTIGYGDIYPLTFVGKLMGIITALLGIGMVAIPTGIISASFVDYGRRAQKDDTSS